MNKGVGLDDDFVVVVLLNVETFEASTSITLLMKSY